MTKIQRSILFIYTSKQTENKFKKTISFHRRYICIYYLFIYLFIHLFLAALGLPCCVQAFSSCGEWGLHFVVVRGLLIAVASLVVEHGL